MSGGGGTDRHGRPDYVNPRGNPTSVDLESPTKTGKDGEESLSHVSEEPIGTRKPVNTSKSTGLVSECWTPVTYRLQQ